jgi:hypothetical protein
LNLPLELIAKVILPQAQSTFSSTPGKSQLPEILTVARISFVPNKFALCSGGMHLAEVSLA